MDSIQAERRGEEAKRLLGEELYKESWVALREQIVVRLESEELTNDQRLELVNLLRQHRRAKRYLEQVMVTGTMVAMEEQRKRSIADRILRRA